MITIHSAVEIHKTITTGFIDEYGENKILEKGTFEKREDCDFRWWLSLKGLDAFYTSYNKAHENI